MRLQPQAQAPLGSAVTVRGGAPPPECRFPRPGGPYAATCAFRVPWGHRAHLPNLGLPGDEL